MATAAGETAAVAAPMISAAAWTAAPDSDGDGTSEPADAAFEVAYAITATDVALTTPSPAGGAVHVLADHRGTVRAAWSDPAALRADPADALAGEPGTGGGAGDPAPTTTPTSTTTTVPQPVVTALPFGAAGDGNGLITHLGTETFANPAVTGRVDFWATYAHQSRTARYMTDRTTATSWNNSDGNGGVASPTIYLDLGPNRRIDVDHYTMAVSSADVGSQPRNWTVAGWTGDDADSWVTLRAHTNDSTAAAGWGDWAVADSGAYRYLRVNVTKTACCSAAQWATIAELEFYGTLTVDPDPAEYAYTGFGDGNGIFAALGAGANPALTGAVTVSSSVAPTAAFSAHGVTNPDGTGGWSSYGTAQSWLGWDFGPYRRVDVSRYTIGSWNDPSLPRNWVLEGRNTGDTTWTTLRSQSGDPKLWHVGDTAGWWVTDGAAAYRELRVRFTGNATVGGYQYLRDVELYGTIHDTTPPERTHPYTVPAGTDGGGILAGLRAAGTLPAATTGPHTSGQGGDKLIDGTGSWFHSDNGTTWVLLDFGAGHHVDIDRYALRTTTDNAQVRNWSLLGSNDATAWTPLRSHDSTEPVVSKDFTGTDHWYDWWVADGDAGYRYVKLQFNGASTVGSWQVLSELELYGTHR